MTFRERNYRKHPHTASFLKTFHTAGHGLPAYTGQAVADAEERSAMNFLAGDAPATREARCLECSGFHSGGASCSTQAKAAERIERMQQNTIEVSGWSVLTGPDLVSEKQAKWMISIANRPSITDAMRESLKTRLFQGFARAAASQFIDRYKDTPTAAAESAKIEAVAPGATEEEFRVAYPAKADPIPAHKYGILKDGEVKCYELDYGKPGSRWEGFTFLSRISSDDRFPIRNKAEKQAILDQIRADGIEASQILAGVTLRRCRRCGRTLSDTKNPYFDVALGPDCGAM